jgi:hypothetical protein
VQDGDQQDGDRAGEVEGASRGLEDGVGVAQVGLDVVGLALGLLVSRAWAISGREGIASRTRSAASRSAAKLSLPPSQ